MATIVKLPNGEYYLAKMKGITAGIKTKRNKSKFQYIFGVLGSNIGLGQVYIPVELRGKRIRLKVEEVKCL